MEQIYENVRPKLVRLSGELAPELGEMTGTQFFPHVARHARRTVNPPPETWVAFGPSRRGYKRDAHFALCISRAGIHARIIVGHESERRAEMAKRLRQCANALVASFQGTRIARYDTWDFRDLPPKRPADRAFFESLADGLAQRAGGIDAGFGWPVGDAVNLERAELLDAYRELAPLYRVVEISG
jgi:hypothetical protein